MCKYIIISYSIVTSFFFPFYCAKPGKVVQDVTSTSGSHADVPADHDY